MVVVFGATWVRALVGGFSPDAQVMTLDLMRVMALGMPASVMINVLASGEIAIGKSRLATIRSSLLNTSVIIGLVFVYLTHQWMALAWSFAIAFNTLSLWGLWTMIRDGSIDFRGLTIADVIDAAQDFWRKLIPFLFVPLADQGNLWVERVLASRASVGSVASLDYARTITDSAVLFISQPLGLALLSVADSEDQRARIEVVIRRLLVAAIPACAMLALFAPDLARLVFARGAFNDTAVQMTGETLRGISMGLHNRLDCASIAEQGRSKQDGRAASCLGLCVKSGVQFYRVSCNRIGQSWHVVAGYRRVCQGPRLVGGDGLLPWPDKVNNHFNYICGISNNYYFGVRDVYSINFHR